MKYVFLFGHRKNCGKNILTDFTIDILNRKDISHYHTYFAKPLKKLVSEKYELDFNKMEDRDYKNWIVPWVGGKTVRQILIEDSYYSKLLWNEIWVSKIKNEILNSNKMISIISDFRYPIEYEFLQRELINTHRVLKILVHRSDIPFENDGADGELPDLEKSEYWDYIISNEKIDSWQNNLKNQMIKLLETEKII